MFALIRREIRDHAIFFMGAFILSAVSVGLSIPMLDNYRPLELAEFNSGVGFFVFTIAILGFFAMGSVQMYTDRSRRVSAFLSTLSVSRSRILLAKIIAGVLAILIALVPIAVAVTLLLKINAPPIPIYSAMVLDVFAGTFLAVFACYCIGLRAGWNPIRRAPALGGIGLTCILVTLPLINGFTPEFMAILSLFIVASLIRIWQMFTSTPL